MKNKLRRRRLQTASGSSVEGRNSRRRGRGSLLQRAAISSVNRSVPAIIHRPCCHVRETSFLMLKLQFILVVSRKQILVIVTTVCQVNNICSLFI